MLIERKSLYSGDTHTLDIPITDEQLNRWMAGEKIQNVCPHLTPDQREFIITGITAEEWNKMFKPE